MAKKRRKPLKRATNTNQAITLRNRYTENLDKWIKTMSQAAKKVRYYQDKVKFYTDRVDELEQQTAAEAATREQQLLDRQLELLGEREAREINLD